ncbi:MAG: efflux transporter periplasmic adaptor subunit, partial [Oxalobacter sp.]|nr:efflux transporter periplasmic adaptor subunit [Oxalobacter sp.]
MENQARVTGMVVAMVLSLLLSGCGKRQDDAVMERPEVTTMTVRAADLPVTMEYVAQTASSHKVNIQARVSGFLQKRLYQ